MTITHERGMVIIDPSVTPGDPEAEGELDRIKAFVLSYVGDDLKRARSSRSPIGVVVHGLGAIVRERLMEQFNNITILEIVKTKEGYRPRQ